MKKLGKFFVLAVLIQFLGILACSGGGSASDYAKIEADTQNITGTGDSTNGSGNSEDSEATNGSGDSENFEVTDGSGGSENSEATNGSGDSENSEDTDGSADSGNSGISSNFNVTVENGVLVINTDDEGAIVIDGTELTLVVDDGNGGLSLADGVSIALSDNSGNAVSGDVSVDGETGTIYFSPQSGLDSNETYTLSLEVNGQVYETTVIVSVEDGETEEPLFADVPFYPKGTYSMNDLMVQGKAIMGWEFGESPKAFRMKLTGLGEGEVALLTIYGTYNIENHEDEVFYQRWAGGSHDGEPCKDYEWRGNIISINEDDASLDSETNDNSFWSTYVEIKIMKDGVDVTAQSEVLLIIK